MLGRACMHPVSGAEAALRIRESGKLRPESGAVQEPADSLADCRR